MLSGTDLEVGIRVEIDNVEVEAPGTVILPIDRMGSILRESSDEMIQIQCDGAIIDIRGANSQFQLPSVNADEFPPVPAFEEESCYELSTPLFRQLVRRTSFATDPESSRYALGGVLLEFEGERVTVVGTDGRRLARQEGPVQRIGQPGGDEQSTIVPTRAMQLLERTLADDAENVRLAVRENDVLVRSGSATLYSRLVEGRFPRWRDVFPKQPDGVKIELPVGVFHTAVRQAAIVTSNDRRGVAFAFADGKVSLTAHGAELGESHVELPIAYDADPQAVDLDPRYVADFLRVLDPDGMFAIELRGSATAAVFLTDDGYAYVVMPLARDQR
jgi:DNA polymerase-3 subunit beta